MAKAAGIYVEILIQADLETVWRHTQSPAVHQRWDLRFTRIDYLPRPDPTEPQRFLYETRLGFGLAIRGTGESVAQRTAAHAASSLRFASDDPKSLIRAGSGYWRYVPTDAGMRFFTWYDYDPRFGQVGRLIDRYAFRPLMGWATAWSFDRLRLWVEGRQSPEASMSFALIHGVARTAAAFIWIWHGLVPKLLYGHLDERLMLADAGASPDLMRLFGGAEVLFGGLMLIAWRWRSALLLTIGLMILATVGVILRSPRYVTAAFNPITLNWAMISLSLIGWLAWPHVPTARRCRRAE